MVENVSIPIAINLAYLFYNFFRINKNTRKALKWFFNELKKNLK